MIYMENEDYRAMCRSEVRILKMQSNWNLKLSAKDELKRQMEFLEIAKYKKIPIYWYYIFARSGWLDILFRLKQEKLIRNIEKRIKELQREQGK